MKKTRQWAPNPYAIAQLLLDNLDIEGVYESSGQKADEFLHRAFNSKGEQGTVTEAVELFRQLALAVGRPMSTAEVLELAEAKRAAQLFRVEQIKRVLPYLVPLLDAEFAPFQNVQTQGLSGRTWFGDAGQLMIEDASYLDPIQGAISNCYLISAMIALAWVKPPSWQTGLRSARFSPPDESAFVWRFHSERGRERSPVKISGRIPINAKKKPRYARSASGESWPALLEKAYVMKMRSAKAKEAEPTLADYQAIEKKGSTPPLACQALAGGQIDGEVLDHASDAKLFSPSRKGLINASGIVRRPLMAWTKDDIGIQDKKVWEKTGLWPNHAYAVLGVMRSKHIVLRNPHGVATTARRGYATGKWHPPGRDPVELNKNGVFAISPPVFFKHFEDVGWVEHAAQSSGP